jgi:hypothetical protein
MRRISLSFMALAMLMGCANYAAKTVPDRDIMNTSWRCAGALSLRFVDYDIVNFYDHGKDVDKDGKSTYVPVAARNFYFESDYIDDLSLDVDPPIAIAGKETRIGSWSLSNYVLSLQFLVQDPSKLPVISYLPDIQKSFPVSFHTDYLGTEELWLDGADWKPRFAKQ